MDNEGLIFRGGKNMALLPMLLLLCRVHYSFQFSMSLT